MKIALYTSNRTTIPPVKGVIAASAYLTGLLADGLTDLGHDVTLYAPKGSQTKATLIDLDMKPHSLDFALQKEEWVLKMSLGMKQIYLGELYKNAKDFDIIHLQNEPVYLGMPFARLSPNPTVFTNHNVFVNNEKEILHYYKDLPIITISDYQKKMFPELNFVGTVYNGIEIEKFPFFKDANTEDYLYFTGRLVTQKGVRQAIEAAHLAGRKLIMSGVGKKDFIDSEIKPYLSDKIIYTGPAYKETPEWYEAYGNAKASVFPLQWEEPFGLTYIESMATGTPVITFARGAAPEIIKDGVTGYLVNPSDDDIRGNFIIKQTGTKGIVEAIQKMYALSKNKYLQMRIASHNHIEQNFTVEKMVKGYESMYKKIVSQKGR